MRDKYCSGKKIRTEKVIIMCLKIFGFNRPLISSTQFDAVVNLLKSNGVTVITFNDCPLPAKPDAIFPNNWFSTHSNGTVIIYPMMAPSRRLEQRMDIIKYLEDVYSTYVTIKFFDSLTTKGRLFLFHHSLDMKTDVNLSISCLQNDGIRKDNL